LIDDGGHGDQLVDGYEAESDFENDRTDNKTGLYTIAIFYKNYGCKTTNIHDVHLLLAPLSRLLLPRELS
jgi:hypothetical protein